MIIKAQNSIPREAYERLVGGYANKKGRKLPNPTMIERMMRELIISMISEMSIEDLKKAFQIEIINPHTRGEELHLTPEHIDLRSKLLMSNEIMFRATLITVDKPKQIF